MLSRVASQLKRLVYVLLFVCVYVCLYVYVYVYTWCPKKMRFSENYSVCFTPQILWNLDYSFLSYKKIEIHIFCQVQNHLLVISES